LSALLGKAKIRADTVLLRSFVDDNYGQKNPIRAIQVSVPANQLHDFFDVLDNRPGSPAQLADVLFPRLAEVDNNG
jgi:hypothetical protein